MTEELPELPIGATILSPEMIAKRMVWDVVPCNMAVDVSKQLGLQPASEDVEEMEHRASHERLAGSEALFPVVQALTQDAVKAAVYALLLGSADPSGRDNEGNVIEGEAMERIMTIFPLVLQTTYAVIAELQDVGFLVSPMALGRHVAGSVAVSSAEASAQGLTPMEILHNMVEELRKQGIIAEEGISMEEFDIDGDEEEDVD